MSGSLGKRCGIVSLNMERLITQRNELTAFVRMRYANQNALLDVDPSFKIDFIKALQL